MRQGCAGERGCWPLKLRFLKAESPWAALPARVVGWGLVSHSPAQPFSGPSEAGWEASPLCHCPAPSQGQPRPKWSWALLCWVSQKRHESRCPGLPAANLELQGIAVPCSHSHLSLQKHPGLSSRVPSPQRAPLNTVVCFQLLGLRVRDTGAKWGW